MSKRKRSGWLTVLPLLVAAGCIVTSGQILVTADLGDFVVTPATVERINVDLNDISDYTDNKEKLKDLADIAVLGEVTNTGSDPIDVVAYMTREPTTFTTASQVMASGLQIWGPFRVAAGATVRIDWNASAALIGTNKNVLIEEVKGDGRFTGYVLGAAGTYSFTVTDGQLALILDVGY